MLGMRDSHNMCQQIEMFQSLVRILRCLAGEQLCRQMSIGRRRFSLCFRVPGFRMSWPTQVAGVDVQFFVRINRAEPLTGALGCRRYNPCFPRLEGVRVCLDETRGRRHARSPSPRAKGSLSGTRLRRGRPVYAACRGAGPGAGGFFPGAIPLLLFGASNPCRLRAQRVLHLIKFSLVYVEGRLPSRTDGGRDGCGGGTASGEISGRS